MKISVVLCTYNRAERVTQPIDAVLASAEEAGLGGDVELVVVDDGSADATPKVLAGYPDKRLRIVRRPNGGLCTARNTGLALARGEWTIFLDDDDLPESKWLTALAEPMDADDVGITCCGGELVDDVGLPIGPHLVRSLGAPFGGAVGSFLPGTFAARTTLLREVGGYLQGLGAAHQYELFIRLVTAADAAGMRMAATTDSVIKLERRTANDRPVVNPRLLYDGTRWVLARHDTVMGAGGDERADFEAVVGAAAARLGLWPSARERFWRAARARPGSVKQWGRAALATLPGVRQRVWGRHGAWASHDVAEMGVLCQKPTLLAPGPVASASSAVPPGPQGAAVDVDVVDEAAGEPLTVDAEPVELDLRPAPEYFLSWRYRTNPVASADAAGAAYWSEGMASTDVRNQVPVYRWGARLARKRGWKRTLDVGTGSGHKLVTYFQGDTVGFDQGSGVELARRDHPDRRWLEGDLADPQAWAQLDGWRPDLTICADVIEHVEDPIDLLHRMAAVADGGPLLISTPDRRLNDAGRALGPPSNPRHVREWTAEQFELLLLSTGFEVEQRRHLLPRAYSVSRTELNRTAYRALTLKAVPDPRLCMAFLVRAR